MSSEETPQAKGDCSSWQCSKEEFLYLFIFPNLSNAGILITIFTYPFLLQYLWIFSTN